MDPLTDYEMRLRNEVLRPRIWISRDDRDKLLLALLGGCITFKEAGEVIDRQMDIQRGTGIDFALRATTEQAKAESLKMMESVSRPCEARN